MSPMRKYLVVVLLFFAGIAFKAQAQNVYAALHGTVTDLDWFGDSERNGDGAEHEHRDHNRSPSGLKWVLHFHPVAGRRTVHGDGFIAWI